MSFYYKKQLISGVNVPSEYTLAEYNNLTVKPQEWIRTDSPTENASKLLRLKDVNINNPTDNEVLAYDNILHKWTNQKASGGLVARIKVLSETGSTVTATKDATTITLVEVTSGVFQCEIEEYGTWVVNSTYDNFAIQESVVVDTAKVYTVTTNHFRASITVTYPSDATVSCSKIGQETQYADSNPYTFEVEESGIWTITTTKDGKSWTQDVVISTSGEEDDIESVPDGNTVTANDITYLLYCSEVFDKSYTTLSQILNDSDTLFAVINSENGIDYLVRSTSYASDIASNQTAMSVIGASDYASNTLLEDTTWRTALLTSSYASSIINTENSVMYGNTIPTGECSASSTNGSNSPYKAFNGSTSNYWEASSTTNSWVQYAFANAVKIQKCVITPNYASSNLCAKNYKVQASNDNSTWVDLYTGTFNNTNDETATIVFRNVNAYKYYRINTIDAYGSNRIGYKSIKFFGRQNGGIQTWLRAGGITNKQYTTLSAVLADTSTVATLMANNDAVDYLVTVHSWSSDICYDENAMQCIGANNYCADTLIADPSWLADIYISENYYAYVLNVQTPMMTSNTTPSGEVFASSVASGQAYLAFDGYYETCVSIPNAVGNYVGYDFGSAKRMCLAVFQVENTSGTTYKLQGSNDGTTWTDIESFSSDSFIPNSLYINDTYRMYRFYQNSKTTNNANIDYYDITLYGRQDV